MKISDSINLRSIGGKIMMGFMLASIIGSMDVAPALAKDGRDGKGKHDNSRYENRGRGNDRDRGRHVQNRRGYRSDGYRGRAYIPPPVIFAPPEPPGVNIFFPPFIFRR